MSPGDFPLGSQHHSCCTTGTSTHIEGELCATMRRTQEPIKNTSKATTFVPLQEKRKYSWGGVKGSQRPRRTHCFALAFPDLHVMWWPAWNHTRLSLGMKNCKENVEKLNKKWLKNIFSYFKLAFPWELDYTDEGLCTKKQRTRQAEN